jgi:hypothetical protein
LITRALIAAASIGTFAILVTAMGPVRQANDPSGVDDVTVPSTTGPVVVDPGGTATTVLAVGDIGQMSASLHHRSTPVSPSTTGP